jgi:hypothetical protein
MPDQYRRCNHKVPMALGPAHPAWIPRDLDRADFPRQLHADDEEKVESRTAHCGQLCWRLLHAAAVLSVGRDSRHVSNHRNRQQQRVPREFCTNHAAGGGGKEAEYPQHCDHRTRNLSRPGTGDACEGLLWRVQKARATNLNAISRVFFNNITFALFNVVFNPFCTHYVVINVLVYL